MVITVITHSRAGAAGHGIPPRSLPARQRRPARRDAAEPLPRHRRQRKPPGILPCGRQLFSITPSAARQLRSGKILQQLFCRGICGAIRRAGQPGSRNARTFRW